MQRRAFIKFLVTTPLGRLLAGLAAAGGAASVIYIDLLRKDVGGVREGGGAELYLSYPRLRGSMCLEEAIAHRRSVREYTDEPITLEELAQLLWAAYGISEVKHGLRTAPSAGAQYPLELYVVAGTRAVQTREGYLAAGVYHYSPHRHSIVLRRRGDFRKELYHAALEQEWVLRAPLSLIFTAVYERTTRVYGERGRVRYVPMDLGHAAQNVYLQATALGLGTVAVGAFYDEDVAQILQLPPWGTPLYIMPVGRPVKKYKITEEELIQYFNQHR